MAAFLRAIFLAMFLAAFLTTPQRARQAWLAASGACEPTLMDGLL